MTEKNVEKDVEKKTKRNMSIPLDPDDKQKVVDAAVLETVEAGAIITPTVLARGLIMAGVERILAAGAGKTGAPE